MLTLLQVFNKSNARGVSCDLVTGEERRLVSTETSSCLLQYLNILNYCIIIFRYILTTVDTFYKV
jgi:hypothetical protein